MKKRNVFIYFLFFILIISLILIYNAKASFSKIKNVSNVVQEIKNVRGLDFYYNSIPSFKINLKDTTLKKINNGSKEDKYYNNHLLVENNGDIVYDGVVTVKGRGNTTWALPKKPYQITLDDKTDFFGMGKAKKWILLANYLDPSLLKTDLAFKIGRMIDADYTLNGVFIDLYVDDEYLGVYYLTHKVEIGESVVNLSNYDGVLMEMDNVHYNLEKEEAFVSDYFENHFVLKDIVNKDYLEVASTEFMKKINTLEKAVKTKNWKLINTVLDVESYAKYYVVNKFTRNRDAYFTSLYLYMDGVDDKIHIGPIWDYDSSFGFFDMKNDYNERNEFFNRLMKMPEFKKVAAKYQKMILDNKEEIEKEINKQILILGERAQTNFDLWNYKKEYEIEDYDKSVNKLRDFIEDRINEL